MVGTPTLIPTLFLVRTSNLIPALIVLLNYGVTRLVTIIPFEKLLLLFHLLWIAIP